MIKSCQIGRGHWFKTVTHLTHFNAYTSQYVAFGSQWNLYLREAVTVYVFYIYDERTGQTGVTAKVHNPL